VCYLRLTTYCIPQAGLWRSYVIGCILWHFHCYVVSLSLARPQRYWPDRNMLQVIIITRLYAMYQRSRKILIPLIVTFLAINIFDVVVAIMTTMHTSGGRFNCGWQNCTWSSLMNTRGIHSLRHLYVLDWLCGRYRNSEFHHLDALHCVGGPHTVSSSLDCGKTPPWTATTFARRDCGRLFHGVDQDSYVLLCEVSSYFDYCSLFPLKDRTW
jgi:hypothetical protein